MVNRRSADRGAANERAWAQSVPPVSWDDSQITNSYANVCNVSSSRQEVVLAFGINRSWERNADEVQVKLTDRVILSPMAAKRLTTLLNNVVQQYEDRFGAMDLGIPRQSVPATLME